MSSGLRPVFSADARQHAWTNLLAVMECEHVVGPTFPMENAMGTGLSLDPPADALKCGKDAASGR
jgi:hypothetical protein